MKQAITPAVVIILVMLLINAGATLALWTTTNDVADNAKTSAATALKVANNNERLINLRVDQTCIIEERKNEPAPSFCDEPGVGLPEKNGK